MDGRLLVIERGQELNSAIKQFANAQGITSAQINGIGAINEVELGYFDVHKREYIRKNFGEADLELISLNGNISVKEGDLFVHLHTIVSDDQFQCFAGHLFTARVAITAEVFLFPTADRPTRSLDEKTGLHLISKGCEKI